MIWIKYVIAVLFMTASTSASSQSISWTKFEDLNDSLALEMKPVMVFIYADWCKFCHMQEETTFKDSSVIENLKDYYCLKLNSEESSPMTFLGREYLSRQISDGIYEHELAFFLTGKFDERLVLPSTVIFDNELELKQNTEGLVKVHELNKLLID